MKTEKIRRLEQYIRMAHMLNNSNFQPADHNMARNALLDGARTDAMIVPHEFKMLMDITSLI